MTTTERQLGTAWSDYDESVPGADASAAARAVLDELRQRRAAGASPLSAVRRVVVVASSSRGGSTVLGALLRACPGLVHLRAEVNPLFAAARLADGGDTGRRAALEAELAADIGGPTSTLPADDVGSFAATVAWRLVAQWPDAGIDPAAVEHWVRLTLRDLAADDDAWTPPAFPDAAAFHVALLRRVRQAHPEVNPWYYDLPAETVRRAFPGIEPPTGPPARRFVEMPPFVLVGPWRRPHPDELASMPLILTTPRNSFRLSVIESLFPAARLSVLHLTRNPAAAVNGLRDAWLHRGFFNCRLNPDPAGRPPLDIPGYSDRFPAWGTHWWNFDFWPRWEAVTSQPLASVCAEQWRQPHEAALAWIDEHRADSHRLRFEDVVGPEPARRQAFAALARWMDLPAVERLADLVLPPLMATAKPRPGRWRDRADVLLPALVDPAIADLCARLGYADRATWT